MSPLHSLLWHLIWNCHLLFLHLLTLLIPFFPAVLFSITPTATWHSMHLCAFVCHAPLKYMFWEGRDFALFIAISLTPRIEPGTEHAFNKYLLHLSGWCKLITAFMNSITWIYPHLFNWLSFDGSISWFQCFVIKNQLLQNLGCERLYRQMTWFLQQRNCKGNEREMDGVGEKASRWKETWEILIYISK